MIISGIDHVQLAMPPGGEDRARHFYSRVLGIPEVPKPSNLAARGGCWFEEGKLKVHLGVERDGSPALKAHPAFLVGGLVALKEKICTSGYKVTDDEPLEGFYRIYVSDPFGNRIELMEPS
jgi:catechol 2,3-dioxygenase-like lactoylglutathione lyase family enzyme